MTRGVLGIWYWRDDSIAVRQQVGKYGSGGARMTPDRWERALATSRATLANRLGESGRVKML
jgi:arabinogalactan endo-1,4-beta-galactosidase